MANTTIQFSKKLTRPVAEFPELNAFVGQDLEVIVRSNSDQSRIGEPIETAATFLGTRSADIPRVPTLEEMQEFRAMRGDPKFQKQWPYFDLVLSGQVSIDEDAVIAARGSNVIDTRGYECSDS